MTLAFFQQFLFETANLFADAFYVCKQPLPLTFRQQLASCDCVYASSRFVQGAQCNIKVTIQFSSGMFTTSFCNVKYNGQHRTSDLAANTEAVLLRKFFY